MGARLGTERESTACAGILEQSMGARLGTEESRIRVAVPARQASEAHRLAESIPVP